MRLRRWARWWLTPTYCRPEARHEIPRPRRRLEVFIRGDGAQVARLRAVLEIPAPITAEQAERIRQTWLATYHPNLVATLTTPPPGFLGEGAGALDPEDRA